MQLRCDLATCMRYCFPIGTTMDRTIPLACGAIIVTTGHFCYLIVVGIRALKARFVASL